MRHGCFAGFASSCGSSQAHDAHSGAWESHTLVFNKDNDRRYFLLLEPIALIVPADIQPYPSDNRLAKQLQVISSRSRRFDR
jgi:hypothetical protein